MWVRRTSFSPPFRFGSQKPPAPPPKIPDFYHSYLLFRRFTSFSMLHINNIVDNGRGNHRRSDAELPHNGQFNYTIFSKHHAARTASAPDHAF